MKLDKLIERNLINRRFISEFYHLGKIIITPEIEEELVHHKVQSWQKNQTFIFPVKNLTKKETVMNDGFDEADASIFGIEKLHEKIVITEDRPLLKYAAPQFEKFLHFADFIVLLAEFGLLSKNNAIRLQKSLYDLRHIGKKRWKHNTKRAQLV